MPLSKDLSAASATPLVLSILKQGDSYGYAIINSVKKLSNEKMIWADGMLYPILHRLERKDFIESYWGKSDTGRRRKYYRLCVAGEQELSLQLQNWNSIYHMLQKLEQEPCLT